MKSPFRPRDWVPALSTRRRGGVFGDFGLYFVLHRFIAHNQRLFEPFLIVLRSFEVITVCGYN